MEDDTTRYGAEIDRARDAIRQLQAMQTERPFIRDEDLSADARAALEAAIRLMDAPAVRQGPSVLHGPSGEQPDPRTETHAVG